jgi:DNA-binding GntR family transcriptional regulator
VSPLGIVQREARHAVDLELGFVLGPLKGFERAPGFRRTTYFAVVASNHTEPKSDEAMAETVFAYVRDRIVDGTYEQGSRIREALVAETLNISRTPVREAFVRLQYAGLVQVNRNRGAAVPVWTRHDFEEIFGLRIILESFGARLAAEFITQDEIVELQRLANSIDQGLHSREPGYLLGCLTLNSDFHRLLVAAGRNARLDAIVANLTHLPLMYRALSLQNPEEAGRSFAQHHDMITALRRRDGDWAEALMRAHVAHGRDVMRRTYPEES